MWAHNYPYLRDYNFLTELDNENIKQYHLRIVSLDWKKESVIGEIQGYATGGTININGASAIRRSGSLNMIADESNYKILDVNNIFSINKKIGIEVGLYNTTTQYSTYEILWFPLGVYIIKNASVTRNDKNWNISLQLSDKMCLLNGDVGGKLPAAVNFSEEKLVDEYGNSLGTNYLLLREIIRNLVYEYGGIQLGQIFINDIEDRVQALMRWGGKIPLYRTENSSVGGKYKNYSFSLIDGTDKINPGEPVGYIKTDFIWPEKEPLKGNLGESVTTILDKIVKVLGDFEYYFDLGGNFIFQKKHIFTKEIYVKPDKNNFVDYSVGLGVDKILYDFRNKKIITAYQNTPQYANIKNDYIVWGSKKISGDKTIPIRYHLAIDKKPTFTTTDKTLVEWFDGPYGRQVKQALITNVNPFTATDVDKSKKYFYNNKIYGYSEQHKTFVEYSKNKIAWIRPTDWRTVLYLQNFTSLNTSYNSLRYSKELAVEWPKIYNIMDTNDGAANGIPIYKGNYLEIDQTDYQYFLDILEGTPSGAPNQDLSIENIGLRSQVKNETGVNCIFRPEIPSILLIESGGKNAQDDFLSSQQEDRSIVSKEIFEQLTLSLAFNSAYDRVVDMLFNSIGYSETISVTTLPIFYLEPNRLIQVEDEKSNIKGKYIIKSFSIPLAPNGTMTLSCSKPTERI